MRNRNRGFFGGSSISALRIAKPRTCFPGSNSYRTKGWKKEYFLSVSWRSITQRVKTSPIIQLDSFGWLLIRGLVDIAQIFVCMFAMFNSIQNGMYVPTGFKGLMYPDFSLASMQFMHLIRSQKAGFIEDICTGDRVPWCIFRGTMIAVVVVVREREKRRGCTLRNRNPAVSLQKPKLLKTCRDNQRLAATLFSHKTKGCFQVSQNAPMKHWAPRLQTSLCVLLLLPALWTTRCPDKPDLILETPERDQVVSAASASYRYIYSWRSPPYSHFRPPMFQPTLVFGQ